MCRVGRASALALALLALAFIPAQYAAAQDVPGDGTTTIRLAVPGTLTSNIGSSPDQDAFLVALVSGGTYRFDTERASGTFLDTTLGLYPPGHTNFAGSSDASCHNATGVLAGNDDSGLSLTTNSRITWTATQTGDHVLCVDAFGAVGPTGGYTLTATVTSEPPPTPDLAATSVTFAGNLPTTNEEGVAVTNLTAGQSGLTLNVAVANTAAPATAAMIQVYRSPIVVVAGSPPTAPGCSSANVLCAAGQPAAIGAFASGGDTPQTSSTFIVPAADAVYHFFACFTDAAETTAFTDNCTPSIPARVGASPVIPPEVAVNPSPELRRFTFSAAAGDLATVNAAPGERFTVIGRNADGTQITDATFRIMWSVEKSPRNAAEQALPASAFGGFDNSNAVATVFTASDVNGRRAFIRPRLNSGGSFVNNGRLMVTVARPANSGAPSFAAGETDPIAHVYSPTAVVNLTLPAATGGDGGRAYTLIAPTASTLAELGLVFNGNADARTLTGAIRADAPLQVNDFTYRVQDLDADTEAGDRADLTLRITVEEVDDLIPNFGAVIDPQTYEINVAVSVTLPAAIGGNPPLIYAITEPLPDGLTFTAATRVLSGTPTAVQDALDYTYTVTDTDGALQAPNDSRELPFTITITGPLGFVGGATIDPQLYFTNRPSVSVTLPAAGGGTAPYAYAITEPLPDGLTFDAGSRVLSGVPTTNQDATDYTYTATDSAGTPASVSQTFSIAVARDTNPRFANTSFPASPPFLGFRTVGITRNKPFSLTLPAATGGNPPLRYSSDSLSILPNNFRLDPVTRILTGTPVFGQLRVRDYRVTDADGDRATYAPSWRLFVQADTTPNLPAVPDQIYFAGVAVNVTLPPGSGGNRTLSYSLTPALPANLTFDGRANRRTITGTVAAATAAADYTYTVTDADGSTRNRVFNLAVIMPLTFGGTNAGALTEDNDNPTTLLDEHVVTLTNLNPSPHNNPEWAPQTDTPGIYGTFSIANNGAWDYTLVNTDPDTDALAAGVMVTDVFTAVAAVSATATHEITITITGANDAPTAAISAPPAGATTTAGEVITVTGSGADVDTGNMLTYAWTATDGDGNAAGSLADPAVAETTWTAPSTTGSVTLTLTVTDDDSTTPLSATATVDVMVVPVTFGGATTGAVTEDAATNTATGTLTVTNAGSGGTDVVAQTDAPCTYGTFTITAARAWTYTLDNTNSATNALAAGATADDVCTVTAAAGGTQDVTITITGANDAPTAAIDAPTEGMQVDFGSMVTLTATGTDVDTGQTATLTYAWTANPNVGSFADATAEDTTWTAPNSGTAPVTLTLTVMDDATPRLSGMATVTVNPTATAVTFGGSDITGGVTEDAGTTTATGALMITTASTNKNVIAIAATDPEGMGTYGTFSVTEPGVWSYDLDNADPDTNALPAGVTVMDIFTVTASANPDATVDITITVTGANDLHTVTITAPVADNAGNVGNVPSDRPVTLRANAGDPDTGESVSLRYEWTVFPANTGSFADITRLDTTWTPPIINAGEDNIDVTLTLIASDSGSPPNSITASVALTVTGPPGVMSPGIDDGDDSTSTDAPMVLDNSDTNDDGVGSVTGRLEVINAPANTAPDHRITRQPIYGTATLAVAPSGGSLAFQVAGVMVDWTYTLDPTRPATQALTVDTPDTFQVQTTVAGTPAPIVSTITVNLIADAFLDDAPTATVMINGAPGASATVDEGAIVTLTGGGTDPEGDAITDYLWAHTTQTENPTVTLSSTTTREVTFTAPEERTTLGFTLIVTANSMPSPALAIEVQVGRGSERALQKTLAAFGRAFATGTVSIFEDYLSTPARTNTSHFTLGGHKFELAAVGTGRDLSVQTPPSFPNTPTPSFPNDRKTGSDSDHVFHRIGNPVEHAPAQPANLANTINSANLADTTTNGATTSDDTPAATTTTLMSGQDLLMQSAFHLNLNDATAASPGWSFWGRATTGNFNGDTESETADAGEKISVDGSVDSGYLGIDYLTPAGTRLGLAIAQSDGEVDYDEVTGGNTTSGDLEAKLTSILPYIQWQGESTNAWLLLGYGTGDAELATDGADELTNVDIDMQMLAFGLSGDLDRAFARTELSWKASAFAITIESDDQPDLGGVEADSQRLRFAVEGRRPGATSATGGAFTPGWELGMRWEDGDIERGAAADAGLRFDYTNPVNGWSLSGAATSVLFSPEAYDEWTAGVQARLDPGAQGRGITFTLAPGWTKAGRSQQMGMDFSNALGKWTTRGLQLQLTGERTERDDNDIGHNIRLTGSLRF